jgi:hypothetical protein
VLSKLIGDVRVYTEEEEERMMKKTGDLMHKFHSLVRQNLESKEGNKKKFRREAMEDAINATELDLDQEEVNFIILYLFSWTQDIDELETSYLVNMQEKGIRWIKLLKESQSQKKLSSSEQQSLPDSK